MSNQTKTTRRPRSMIVYLASLLLVLVSVFLIFDIAKEYIETLTLNSSLEEVSQQLINLQEENDLLIAQKEKLSDPEYVKNYARGQYMLSQEDEQIFRLPGSNR
ncbi:MAG: septum formation initiator family protein [Erysipelothrix sp.]|nr:septum formation initiator family protein [Erysipelothrix sp.]